MIKKKNEMGRSGTMNERYEKSRMCPSLLCTIIFFGSLYIHAALKITKGFLILMKKIQIELLILCFAVWKEVLNKKINAKEIKTKRLSFQVENLEFL